MPGGSRKSPSLLAPHMAQAGSGTRSVFSGLNQYIVLSYNLHSLLFCHFSGQEVTSQENIFCQLRCPFIFLSDLFYIHCLKIILNLDKIQWIPLEVELIDCFHEDYLTPILPVPYHPHSLSHTSTPHIHILHTHTPCFKMRLCSPGCREISQLFTYCVQRALWAAHPGISSVCFSSCWLERTVHSKQYFLLKCKSSIPILILVGFPGRKQVLCYKP